MRRFDDVRLIRWSSGWLSIEGGEGELARLRVKAGDLMIVGFRVAPGLRHLAACFPPGSSLFLDRRGGRSALAVRVRKAG